jgi:hypothetical protein
MTFRPEIFKNNADRWPLRIARKTFGDFLLVLMTSLMFLVPRLPPVGLGAALFALGVAWSFGVVGRLAVAAIQEGLHTFSTARLLRVFFLSFLGGIGLIGVAVALWLEYTDVLYWLVAVLAALLASASTTAWTLLATTKDLGTRSERGRGGRTSTRQANESRSRGGKGGP